MTGRIVVLGGAGQLGRAAAQAFRSAGWQVVSLVRGSAAHRAVSGTEIVEVDARDTESVVSAVQGADVVLHALNVPYTAWSAYALPLAETAIAAARESGATLVVPGTVFNYGAGMPAVLDETTAMRPTSRKGVMRVEIEARLQQAAQAGLRTIVVRSGDYFGGDGLGSWFDRIVIRDIGAGRLTYPGPLDVIHEWAYLPDLAQALVRVVAARRDLPAYAALGFAGHAVTGRAFATAISRACRRKFQVGRMPWWMLRTLSPVVPVFRELADVAYLWSTPHQINGGALVAVIGEVPHTPLDPAMAAALAALGIRRRSAPAP